MARRGLIFGHADFRRLWIGDTVSQFGSQVSVLAVPLTAVLTLHASTFQVGLLTAVQNAAFLLIGLPAGAWVDRMRRRPVLIAGNLLRAAVLGTVPLAAAFGVLTLAQLYAVVFVAGIGTVFFDVAYQSYLPALVGRDRLLAGNGRLEASRSTANLAGPGLTGFLVQALTAPVAILLDAASFLWSAGWIAAIRTPEPPVAPTDRRRAVRDGLRFFLTHPTLRTLAAYNTTAVLFLSMVHAVVIVFLVRTVGVSAATIGVLAAVSGFGAVLGAFVAQPLARRLGRVRTMLLATVGGNAALLLLPLTAPGVRLACYVIGNGVCSLGIVVFNIVSLSLRQSLCPDHMLGRMNATMRFLAWGMAPVGGVLGGVLGTAIGIRATLWVAGAGFLAAAGWLALGSAAGKLGADRAVEDVGVAQVGGARVEGDPRAVGQGVAEEDTDGADGGHGGRRRVPAVADHVADAGRVADAGTAEVGVLRQRRGQGGGAHRTTGGVG